MPTRSEIALVRSLASKKGRSDTGLFVAEGVKLAGEIFDSDVSVRKVFAREGFVPPRPAGCPVEIVSEKEMDRLSLLKTPTPVLVLAEMPQRPQPVFDDAGTLVLALDDVQDPGNLGTIVRLADWFGIRDIVCSEGTADCFNPKVVQATMGAILRVRVHYGSLNELLAGAAGANLPVYGTFLDGENIYEAALSPGGILVMGNEGRGIGAAAEKHIARRLYIPPYPAAASSAESLNVAVATAVACAEFRRRLQ